MLTAREETVLLLLLKRAGKPVSVLTLTNLVSRTHEAVSINSLRVLISTLRRKLKPQASIIARPGNGYVLTIAEDQ